MSSQIYKNQIPQDWEVVKLEGIVEIYDNLRIPVAASLRKFGTTPYYGANGIQDYVDGFTHNGEFVLIAEDGANDLINYPVNYVNGEIWVNNHAHVVSGKNKIVNNKFLSYCLKITNFSKFIVGGTRTKLNGSILKNIEILLPKDKAEQERIAQVLGDMDELIGAKCELLDKKRAIKQAAAQQLLTPKPHWHTATLGDISLIKTGSRNNQDKNNDGEFPFFVRSATVERISTYSYDCEAILIPGEGGIGSIYHYINGKFDAHQRVYVIRDFNKDIDAKFIFYVLKEYFGKYALQNTVKATVDSLRLPTFQNFEFSLPKDKAEQTKITQILSDMDDEISALQDEIEKLKMIKQGAMDELLSGKIRLKG